MINQIKYGITCSLDHVSENSPVVLKGDIEDVARTAHKIGYEGLEVHLCNPLTYDWKHIKKVCDYNHMEICALATGREFIENNLSLIASDKNDRVKAINRLKEHIEVAAKLGSIVIVGTMRDNITAVTTEEDAMKRLAEAVFELSEFAEKFNVKIVIENILKFISNYLNTIRQVTNFIDYIDKGNVGIHLDTYSMLMEDNNIVEAIKYCQHKLSYVHFSDSSRLFPGGGNIDFKTHLKSLYDCNYSGYVTMECVPYPDGYSCAENAYRYVKALEVIVNIEGIVKR